MATSLKDYLRKYQSTGDEAKQPQKLKKQKVAVKVPGGLIMVDNDAAWQKNIDEDSDEPEVEGDGPQVIEDVEVKRLHQMERVKQHRPYMSIGDDGSGWSTVDRESKDAQRTSDTLRAGSPAVFPSRRTPPEDTSPPRKRIPQTDSLDMSPPRRKSSRADLTDTSRPRKMADGRQAGLITNKELAAESLKKKQQERMKDMEGRGRAVETICRDKRGKRLESLEELLRQQQGEVVKPLEWGKGLAQKREMEEQRAEFETERLKPFARTRDDPELDKMYKERVRWGDPMARLVKRKDPAAELDLKASEKESDLIIPQGSRQRSWLERGVGAPMNRYGIKPGRHWDGEDRSTGFESQMFKAKAEK